jgi:hypothetical protein
MGATKTRWPGTKRHFHTYEWRKMSTGVGRFENGIWKCADPVCSHFMPAYLVNDLLPGKSSFCTCGAPIDLTVQNMKEAIRTAEIDEDTGILTGRPKCEKCLGQREDILEKTREFLSERDFPEYRLSTLHKHEPGPQLKPESQIEESPLCPKCNWNHPIGAECAV